MTTVQATRDDTYRIVDWRVGVLDDALTEAEFRAAVAGLPVDDGSVAVNELGITMLMPAGVPGGSAATAVERVLVAEAISVGDDLLALLAERGRAYRADRPHHPARTAPPHHHNGARQRLPSSSPADDSDYCPKAATTTPSPTRERARWVR